MLTTCLPVPSNVDALRMAVFNVQIVLFTSLSCNATPGISNEADTAVARVTYHGPASVVESTHTTQI